jgi:hypothetical protein
VDIGQKGHINVVSGHGPWPDVLPLIAELSGNSSALVLKRAVQPPLSQAV